MKKYILFMMVFISYYSNAISLNLESEKETYSYNEVVKINLLIDNDGGKIPDGVIVRFLSPNSGFDYIDTYKPYAFEINSNKLLIGTTKFYAIAFINGKSYKSNIIDIDHTHVKSKLTSVRINFDAMGIYSSIENGQTSKDFPNILLKYSDGYKGYMRPKCLELLPTSITKGKNANEIVLLEDSVSGCKISAISRGVVNIKAKVENYTVTMKVVVDGNVSEFN